MSLAVLISLGAKWSFSGTVLGCFYLTRCCVDLGWALGSQ